MWDVNDVSIILGGGIGFALAAQVDEALTRRYRRRQEQHASTRLRPVDHDRTDSRLRGALLVALGLVIVLVGQLAIAALQQSNESTDTVIASSIGGGVASCLVCIAGFMLVSHGRRMRAPDAVRVLPHDARPRIVYLRPFTFDRKSGERISHTEPFKGTHEQRLARAIRKVGPFVAVGDPSERIPSLGAIRVYLNEARWQEGVAELTRTAAVIIVHVGDSPGLAWEVEHVVGLAQPERLILSLVTEDLQRYNDFRDKLGHRFPRGLPAAVGSSNFLYFDEGWTPRPYNRKTSREPIVPPGSPGEQRSQVLLRIGEAERARSFKPLIGVVVFVLALGFTVSRIASDSWFERQGLGLPKMPSLSPVPQLPGTPTFLDRAQTICQRTAAAGRAVQLPASSAGSSERMAFAQARLRLLETMLGDMRALTPPADQADTMRRFLDAVAQAVDRSREQIAAVEARDEGKARSLGVAITADWKMAAALSTDLGFSECVFLT